MEGRLKLKETNTSLGLARPLPKPDPNPFVTHRGLGAFTEADFVKKSPSVSEDIYDPAVQNLCNTTQAIDLNN